MAYKVFRKIEVGRGGGETQRGWEKGRREIILNAKQNSYFNSDSSLGGQGISLSQLGLGSSLGTSG